MFGVTRRLHLGASLAPELLDIVLHYFYKGFNLFKHRAQTALDLGLVTATRNSVYEVTAAGILGATAGEIISPMNAIVITLLRGVDKKESDLIRDLLGIAGMWLLACMLLSGLFLLPTSFID